MILNGEKIYPKDIVIKYFKNNQLTDIQNCLNDDSDIIVINNFNENNLENLIVSLGLPLYEKRNCNSGMTYNVELKKEYGYYKAFANCHLKFPLHTDCSDFSIIPNSIALYCVRQAKKGGESTFARVDEIVDKLDENTVQFLLKNEFSFNSIKRPILYKNINEKYSMVFNRIILERYQKFTNEEFKYIKILVKAIEECTFEHETKKNQLIIFKNDTFLHGRNSFSEDSDRLLKRIRFTI